MHALPWPQQHRVRGVDETLLLSSFSNHGPPEQAYKREHDFADVEPWWQDDEQHHLGLVQLLQPPSRLIDVIVQLG